MQKNSDNNFSYTYSAPTEEERREIESIRRQYLDTRQEHTKADRIKLLHKTVINNARAVSLTLGICGCLIFGLGFSAILEWEMYVLGVIISVVGAVPMALAHPAYKLFIKRGKNKHSQEIIRLSDEILRGKE